MVRRRARLITDPRTPIFFFSSLASTLEGEERDFSFIALDILAFVSFNRVGYHSVFNIKTLNWGVGAGRGGFSSLQWCAVGEIRSVAGVRQRARTSSPDCNLCFLPQPSSRPKTHRQTHTHTHTCGNTQGAGAQGTATVLCHGDRRQQMEKHKVAKMLL